MNRICSALLTLAIVAGAACGVGDTQPRDEVLILPSDPGVRYVGRWDRSEPDRPFASWPGFAVAADFEGRSLKVRLSDPGNFFNVWIDGRRHGVIGGKSGAHRTWTLASGLPPGRHRVLLQRRNISFTAPTVFEGFVAGPTGRIVPASAEPARRIEFIGDSFTVAEGNEAIAATLPWEEKFPVTDFACGYAALLGEALGAEVTAVCRSGSGLVRTWNGLREHPMTERYGWALMEDGAKPWKNTGPSPEIVVISLGLNDFNGLKRADGSVTATDSAEFRHAYHQLIARLRRAHPGVKIVALAPYTPWARENISAVVAEERAGDVFYSQFDKFEGGYVADGHPTVATHRKMAAQILAQWVELGLAPGDAAVAGL